MKRAYFCTVLIFSIFEVILTVVYVLTAIMHGFSESLVLFEDSISSFTKVIAETLNNISNAKYHNLMGQLN